MNAVFGEEAVCEYCERKIVCIDTNKQKWDHLYGSPSHIAAPKKPKFKEVVIDDNDSSIVEE